MNFSKYILFSLLLSIFFISCTSNKRKNVLLDTDFPTENPGSGSIAIDPFPEIIAKLDPAHIHHYQSFNYDSTLAEYIESLNDYILLIKKEEMPKEVRPYVNKILNYFHGEDIYYVDTSGIFIRDKRLFIPLYQYQSFKKRQEIEKANATALRNAKNRDTTEIIIFNGNLGRNGYIEIDLITSRIINFALWC